jgi:hypothetical protein
MTGVWEVRGMEEAPAEKKTQIQSRTNKKERGWIKENNIMLPRPLIHSDEVKKAS